MNTASGTISRYSIAPAGTLTLLANTQVGATGGLGAVDARLSQNGAYLFVDESRIGAVGAFAVHAGDLTELASSPPRCPPAPPQRALSSPSRPTAMRSNHPRRPKNCAAERSKWECGRARGKRLG
jgi:hypothetical protein